MSEKVDDFIGREFPTPKGGVLTVVKLSDNKCCSNKRYLCVCSICSKDKELFPSLFDVLPSNLKKCTPCGCAKSPRWTEYQNLIRVRRECTKRKYIFHGFAEKYKGTTTKLSLENPATSSKWSTTNINSFLGGVGDPVAGRELVREGSVVPVEQHIKDFFRTGSFLEGTLFKPSEDKKYFYNYECPRCSFDEYVKEGLCTGIFQSFIGHLKDGKLSCRCSTHPSWTEKQREYQLKEICKKDGLTFVGWETEYKRYTSYFFWLCKEGHLCKTSVDNFIRGNRCITCAEGACNGHYPLRHTEDDYLYIMLLDDIMIKCGRSFNFKRRSREVEIASSKKVEVLHLFTGTHKEVYDIEQKVKDIMYVNGLNYYTTNSTTWGGSTECYKKDALPMVLEIIGDCNGITKVELQNEE